MNKQAVSAAVALCLLSIAFTQNSTEPANHGIVVANMDRSVKPGDDFYRYANGDWIKRTEIPPDSGYIAIGGYLNDRSTELTRKQTAGLIEDAIKANAPAGSNTRKTADFYRSFMNEASIEAKGIAPLRPHLDVITAIRNKHDLARALGETLRLDVDPLNDGTFHTPNLFGLWVAPGFNEPERYAAYLLQGGLEMPNREYYLSDSSEMHIVELEHGIAEKHVPFADEQEISKANNPSGTAEIPVRRTRHHELWVGLWVGELPSPAARKISAFRTWNLC